MCIEIILSTYIIFTGLLLSAGTLEISDLDEPKITEAFVDGLVLPLMKINHSPSGSVAIVKDGTLIFAKGYGYQDVEKQIPVEADKTLFRPGSVSKLFTWVSVMQLVEQGKLDLDADINTYLKTFKIKDTFPGEPITMRHVMTHSTGFEDGGMGYLIIDDPSRIVPLAESMANFQPERINPPGAQTAYSNYATAVAGLIVANLSGLEFNDYVQKNIFDVLGMKSSSFVEPLPEHLNNNMALAYAFEGGQYLEKPFEIISNFGPAGAQSSTATDMTIFAQAILDGGIYRGNRILKEETVKQMLTRNFSHDERMTGMALGFYETEKNGLRFLGHGGDTGYFHSELVIDQKNNLAFFVSFSGAGGADVRTAFKTNIYDTFYPEEKNIITPPDDFSERASKYAGSYLFWRSSFSTIEKFGKLIMVFSVQPTENNTLVTSIGKHVFQFAEIEKNLFQDINGSIKIAFQENDSGEITGFVLDGMASMSTFKAPFYYTRGFNFFFLGLSVLVFLGVLLRRFYQSAIYKSLNGGNKYAAQSSVLVAATNLFTFIVLGIVLLLVGDQLGTKIPTLFTISLVFPIIATLAGLYHLYQTYLVWNNGLCDGIWARIRFSIVAACSLFMCWFYYFWNIIGFQYLS